EGVLPLALVFQPGEEQNPGGASKMIEEGVLKDPAPGSIFGQHVFPDLEVGKVGFRPGPYMASSDELRIRVKGKGGHAAMPNKNVDPVLIGSHIVTSLQQLVSRYADPTLPSVLSFGKLIADGSTNVIPNEMYLEGTFRTFDEEWREEAHNSIQRMAEGIARSMGGHCEVSIQKGYPYLVNDPGLTEKSRRYACELLGEEQVVDLPLRMTAEDFAYYGQVIPACFYRLGTRNEAKGITSGLHTATFDIDEEALKTGMATMAWEGYRSLQETPSP
ncbi:MAG: M20 family metallopeptidase, partial [Flavobacteriales bacterium]